jgi:hypothetical protein
MEALNVTLSEIIAGNGTHTGRMLGYCPDCGIYHGSPEARMACEGLQAAVNPLEEIAAWRTLKFAVAAENDDYPYRYTRSMAERGRPSITTTTDRFRHGLEMALHIGDRDGAAAERAWFREHEALPVHAVSDCPMQGATY